MTATEWHRALGRSWRRWDRATAMFARPFDPAECERARIAHFALIDDHTAALAERTGTMSMDLEPGFFGSMAAARPAFYDWPSVRRLST